MLLFNVVKSTAFHDNVTKWKYFPRYWPFVRGNHRTPVNFPAQSQWRGALVLSLICARINGWVNGWVNNGEAGDFRRHRAHYDVTVMQRPQWWPVNLAAQFFPWIYCFLYYNGVAGASWHLICRSIVCSTVCSDWQQRKHQSSSLLALCEGNLWVTGSWFTRGFPSQRASNAESVSIP